MNEQKSNKRSELIDSLKNTLTKNKCFIYGTGIVGKRLFEVIKDLSLSEYVNGFVVTKNTGKNEFEDKRIFELEDMQKDAFFLIATSDIYQNEIIYSLLNKGFKRFTNAYLFSCINEEINIDAIPDNIPEIIEVDINELMMMQFENGQFERYDALVAISSAGLEKKEVCWNKETVVSVDCKFHIFDEALTIGKLLCSGTDKVAVKQRNDLLASKYDYLWLQENVKKLQLYEIEEKLQKFITKWNESFIGIIWPPAYSLADEITDTLSKDTRIMKYCDIKMGNDFYDFVRDVYNSDDTDQNHIKDKINYMSNIENSTYDLRIIWFNLDEPDFKIKRYGHTISGKGVRIKTAIRELYKQRLEKYVFDIIFHSSDNYSQSKEIINSLRKLGYVTTY